MNGDVDVVVGQQLEQIAIGSQVDHGPTAIVFDHLGRAAIGRNNHPGNFFGLNRLDKIAVAECAGLVGGLPGVEEGRADGYADNHQ